MKQYTLDYIRSLERNGRTEHIGDMQSRHDVSSKKWELYIRLTDNGLGNGNWFLYVFIHDDGTFDEFSLSYTGAAGDFFYGFKDETAIRQKLYMDGDENLYFHEIAIRYCGENGGDAFYQLIKEYITSRISYVDYDYDDD